MIQAFLVKRFYKGKEVNKHKAKLIQLANE
jgi:hypothetical protein